MTNLQKLYCLQTLARWGLEWGEREDFSGIYNPGYQKALDYLQSLINEELIENRNRQVDFETHAEGMLCNVSPR